MPSWPSIRPAELPVLQIDGGPDLCGTYAISEYLAEEFKAASTDGFVAPLFPGNADDRAEIRRLVDWFHDKLDREVTRELLFEKIYGRLKAGSGHAPDTDILRAVRANLRYHLSYVNHLSHQRRWLAGDEMSFADIAAAAHLSSIDYLGEVPWEDFAAAKSWYARMKSRPAFRSLARRPHAGRPPAEAYANLDF